MAVRYTPADRFVHDRKDGKKFRGAQVRAVDADTLTLGVRLESSLNGERTVARSLAPRAILGDGLVCDHSALELDFELGVTTSPQP